MSDPLRTDPSRAGELAPDPDREAKIEQLLLAGLDHYLAARYEHAINVWTRALFLDRGHARARAYIERARSALAERQRESEEMLQDGVFKDPRLGSSSMVTVTEVKVTPDLRQARAYVSIYGEDADDVIEALNSAAKKAQRELADRLALRHTPKIDFARDDSIAYGAKIESILSDIASEARSEQSERSRVDGLRPAGTRGIREASEDE